MMKNSIDFSFSKELKGWNSALFVFLIIGTLAWFPTLLQNRIFSINNSLEFIIWISIYLVASGLLYLFVGNRLASKHVKANVLISIICIGIIMILIGTNYYLYSNKIFVSKSSLFLSVPFSLFIAFICSEIWIRFSSKD